MCNDDEEERLLLHVAGFDTKDEAISHARHYKIQNEYPNHRWFVIPMEEIVV
jgi:hypothetical protein